MILKLFKYDFMNIGKKLIPFYIAALVIEKQIKITDESFDFKLI